MERRGRKHRKKEKRDDKKRTEMIIEEKWEDREVEKEKKVKKGRDEERGKQEN